MFIFYDLKCNNQTVCHIEKSPNTMFLKLWSANVIILGVIVINTISGVLFFRLPESESQEMGSQYS